MRELTPEIAEKFARKIFTEDRVKKEGEWHIFHSQAVVETALLLSGASYVDRDLLREAAWLIDIGQTIGNNVNHPLRSIEIAKKEFELPEKLKDCIINHENANEPLCEEARIIQIADKVSVLRPELVKLFCKYSKVNPLEKEWNIKFLDYLLVRIPELLRKL